MNAGWQIYKWFSIIYYRVTWYVDSIFSYFVMISYFSQFTYVTTHSPTLPSLYLRHSSFSNHSVASPTSQFILQPFFRFSYVTSSSPNSPGDPPMRIIIAPTRNSNILNKRTVFFSFPSRSELKNGNYFSMNIATLKLNLICFTNIINVTDHYDNKYVRVSNVKNKQ